MKVINTPGTRARKSSTSYNRKRNTVVARKEAYTDGSKSTARKVGYAAVFTNSTRRSLHSHR